MILIMSKLTVQVKHLRNAIGVNLKAVDGAQEPLHEHYEAVEVDPENTDVDHLEQGRNGHISFGFDIVLEAEPLP